MPVTTTVGDGIAAITLDRPAKRNALDAAMLVDLRDRVAEIAARIERDDVRAVVLRGAGGVFCAGADIADWVDPTPQEATALSKLGSETFDAIAVLPVSTVAVVEGTAVGGGLELALACDLRLVTDDARLGLPELGLGNLPSWGGTARLVDAAGLATARHLLLSSELLDGTQAAAAGLATWSVPAAELEAAVARTVAQLLGAEPYAVRLAKEVLRELESHVGVEAALAAHFASLDSSRLRKQDFLDRKAAARAARAPGATTVPAVPEGPAS